MDFIQAIEATIGKEAQKLFLPMQPGDVYQTYADTSSLQKELGFQPNKSINDGIRETVDWYRSYYKI